MRNDLSAVLYTRENCPSSLSITINHGCVLVGLGEVTTAAKTLGHHRHSRGLYKILYLSFWRSTRIGESFDCSGFSITFGVW